MISQSKWLLQLEHLLIVYMQDSLRIEQFTNYHDKNARFVFFLIMVQFVMFWTFEFYIIKCEIISNINDTFY
jgi:hypothetical protein